MMFFFLQGRVAKAVLEKGGKQIVEECKKHG